MIDGNNFVSIRDLGRALNFGVEWDGATNSIIIDTSRDYFDSDVQNSISEFLSQYLSIFSFGERGTDHFGNTLSLDGEPLVFYDWDEQAFFDQNGNELTTAPFLRPIGAGGIVLVARDYQLLDVDNDGIPEIFVTFRWPEPDGVGWTLTEMYRLIDGEYRQIFSHSDRSVSIFTDSQGRLVLFNYNEVDGGYFHMTISNNSVSLTPILTLESPTDENGWLVSGWRQYQQLKNHTTGELYPLSREWLISRLMQFNPQPYIFGMPNMTLTPIVQLNILGQVITAAVRVRLGLE